MLENTTTDMVPLERHCKSSWAAKAGERGITQCLKLVPREEVGGFEISFSCFLLFYSVTLNLFLRRPNSTPWGSPWSSRTSRGRCVEGHPWHKVLPCTARHQHQQSQGACGTHSPGLSTQNLQRSIPRAALLAPALPFLSETIGNDSSSHARSPGSFAPPPPSSPASPQKRREMKLINRKVLSFP